MVILRIESRTLYKCFLPSSLVLDPLSLFFFPLRDTVSKLLRLSLNSLWEFMLVLNLLQPHGWLKLQICTTGPQFIDPPFILYKSGLLRLDSARFNSEWDGDLTKAEKDVEPHILCAWMNTWNFSFHNQFCVLFRRCSFQDPGISKWWRGRTLTR